MIHTLGELVSALRDLEDEYGCDKDVYVSWGVSMRIKDAEYDDDSIYLTMEVDQ